MREREKETIKIETINENTRRMKNKQDTKRQPRQQKSNREKKTPNQETVNEERGEESTRLIDEEAVPRWLCRVIGLIG